MRSIHSISCDMRRTDPSSLLRTIFAGKEWNAQRDAMLRESAQRPRMPELNMTANGDPSFEEAFALLNN